MAISLERIHLLLQVAAEVSQFPSLNGIAGLAGEELADANKEALKALEEKAKKAAEERAKKVAEAAAEEKKAREESEPEHASARRI